MQIIQLSSENQNKAVRAAAQALREGDILLFPTDTIYGLGVDASSAVAVKKLRQLKGRETRKPISIIVPTVKDIHEYAEVSEIAQSFIDRFMPGSLTIVLPAKPSISSEITFNGSVGIRVPNNLFVQELALSFGKPFTATSANRSGRETPKTIHEIVTQFGHDAHNISLAIDSGEHARHLPSTIISCITGVPHLIREGSITREELGL